MENIVGHEKIIESLKNIVKSGKISNAYLFCGMDGTGKFLISKEFAKSILCLNSIDGKYCDNCDSCKTVNSSSDLTILESEEGVIKVDRVRLLCKEIMLKPTISNRRVFIINDADLMNDSAQNALLKSLEEPPKYATIILVATNKSKLKKTILSRCVTIDFHELSKDELISISKQNDIEINDTLLNYSGGSFGKLLSLINCDYLNLIDDFKNSIDSGSILEMNKALSGIKKIKTLKEDINDIINMLVKMLSHTLTEDCKNRVKQISIIEEARNNINRNANLEDSLDYMAVRLWEESKRRN